MTLALDWIGLAAILFFALGFLGHIRALKQDDADNRPLNISADTELEHIATADFLLNSRGGAL